MRFLPFLALSIACLDPKSSTDPDSLDTADSNDTNVNGGASIYDIQSGAILDGETVQLNNVVVTTAVTSEGDGFFVQDEGGGEYSGIYVYTATASGDFSELALVGNKISLSGVVTEYYDYTELTVSSAENIQITGEADVVADVVADVSDWELYEGCLVTLENQTAISGVNNYGEIDLSAGIPMDNLFFNFDADYGAEFGSVTGVISYGFEQFKINPRTESDLVGYVPGEGPAAVTLAEIQQGDYENRTVTVENVVAVTDLVSDHFWVQDAGGGEWGGMYVYVGPWIETPVTVSAGDVLNITGSVSEYYDLTELTLDTAEDLTVVSSDGTPTAVSLSSAPSNWENYESVLVTLENVSVSDDVDQYGQYPLDFNILLGNDLYSPTASNGDTFESLTGLVYYSYGEFKLLPRDADDMSGSTNNDGGDNGSGNNGTEATIYDIQNGTITTGSEVSVSGAIVTAVLSNGNLFVMDPAGGAYSGLVIYPAGATLTASIGDEVSFSGEVVEYYGKTEVSVSDSANFTVTGTGTVSPEVISAVPSDWELYEGVLVTLGAAVTTDDPDQYGESPLDMDNDGVVDIYLDNYLYDAAVPSGTSFISITGVVDYSYGSFRVMPRDANDLSQ